jgi:hypothetical protein
MQFLRIFTYIQVATALITFIQQAQAAFRDRTDAGEAKKAQVLPQFVSFVTALQQSGLIDARVAGGIIAGGSILIDAAVLVLKRAGLLGGVEDATATATVKADDMTDLTGTPAAV